MSRVRVLYVARVYRYIIDGSTTFMHACMRACMHARACMREDRTETEMRSERMLFCFQHEKKLAGNFLIEPTLQYCSLLLYRSLIA